MVIFARCRLQYNDTWFAIVIMIYQLCHLSWFSNRLVNNVCYTARAYVLCYADTRKQIDLLLITNSWIYCVYSDTILRPSSTTCAAWAQLAWLASRKLASKPNLIYCDNSWCKTVYSVLGTLRVILMLLCCITRKVSLLLVGILLKQ